MSIPFPSCELFTSSGHGPVPLTAAAEKKLAELVSNSTRLPQARYDAIASLELAPTLSLRSKKHPEIVFGWYGNHFLGEQALYSNEKAGNLWDQLARIVLSGSDQAQKLAEIAGTIERY